MACNTLLVRTLIGDPDATKINKESLDALVTVYGSNPFRVAAAAARAIGATKGNDVNKRAGDVSISGSDRFKNWESLARELDKQATLYGLGGSSAYAGGISKGDKFAREDDTDRVEPYFTRELHDDPSEDRDDLSNRDI
jgi:hypothetical protein